jgi:hypothetical protein
MVARWLNAPALFSWAQTWRRIIHCVYQAKANRLASSDWRRNAPVEARLAGAGTRIAALSLSLLVGICVALLSNSAAESWL